MDCRIVLAHYTHPASLRSLVLTLLLAMIVPPTGLPQSPDGSTLLRAGQTSLQPLHPATSSTLPVIVQSGISARLGQDQVAYHALILNTKLTASDKVAEDYFGASVSISGDTIVVGVPDSDPDTIDGAGAAYVFTKPGGGWSGSLVEAAKLIASDKAIGAEFGYSVAISGDTVVVGATRSSPGGVTNAGTAYVFVRPGGGWSGTVTETAKLVASAKAADDRFGTSVAISGDTVVVGAVSSDPGYMDAAGAAYVFVKPAGGWSGSRTETAKLTASDKAAGDYFGTFVSISGDTVAIGACGADPGAIDLAGAAYVFVKPGGGWSGSLTQNAKLTASDKATGDDLGRSVAINGDTIVVGADAAGLYLAPRAGAVYVFVRPVAGWSGNLTQNAKLTALDSAANSYLGSSVAISGDIVVAGAPQSDTGGLADAGAAYVFVKPGGGWSGNLTENAKLIATDKAVDDRFGASVALSAGTVVLGAPNSRQGGLYRAGAAYVSLVAAANLSTVSLNFGSQLFAKTSAPQSVTFTNSGNLDLKVGSITANGDFAQTNNCPAMLAPLASCTIDVTFRPKAVGARTGALTIAYSGAGSPATVSLSGTGEGWLVHLPIIFK